MKMLAYLYRVYQFYIFSDDLCPPLPFSGSGPWHKLPCIISGSGKGKSVVGIFAERCGVQIIQVNVLQVKWIHPHNQGLK